MTAPKTFSLRPSKAPNLPIAPVEYDQRYIDNLLNALRLYFAQVDNVGAGLVNSVGGSYLRFPNIAASGNVAQYATADNTPTLVMWDTAESLSGFVLNPGGSATADYSGIFKITYSLQFANTDNAAHDAVVWLKINGVPVDKSTTVFTVPARKSAGIASYVCGYSEVVFPITAGDTIELYWATDLHATSGGAVGLYMPYFPAQTSPYTRPAAPSSIGSITFVSAPN